MFDAFTFLSLMQAVYPTQDGKHHHLYCRGECELGIGIWVDGELKIARISGDDLHMEAGELARKVVTQINDHKRELAENDSDENTDEGIAILVNALKKAFEENGIDPSKLFNGNNEEPAQDKEDGPLTKSFKKREQMRQSDNFILRTLAE